MPTRNVFQDTRPLPQIISTFLVTDTQQSYDVTCSEKKWQIDPACCDWI